EGGRWRGATTAAGVWRRRRQQGHEGVKGTSAAGEALRAVVACPAGRTAGYPLGACLQVALRRADSGGTVESSTTSSGDAAVRPRESYCPTRQGGKHAAGW
ncbi:uncharacterized protein PITG_22522, partial [Phytophthora infestans T30-4]